MLVHGRRLRMPPALAGPAALPESRGVAGPVWASPQAGSHNTVTVPWLRWGGHMVCLLRCVSRCCANFGYLACLLGGCAPTLPQAASHESCRRERDTLVATIEELRRQNDMLHDRLFAITRAEFVCYSEDAIEEISRSLSDLQPALEAYGDRLRDLDDDDVVAELLRTARPPVGTVPTLADQLYRVECGRLVEKQICSRGMRMKKPLEKHTGDTSLVWRGGVGQWSTLGDVCRRLLKAVNSQ